jgi:hypothetical protein
LAGRVAPPAGLFLLGRPRVSRKAARIFTKLDIVLPSFTLADPSQLEQVLMNLCLNARDAMGKGGRLLIGTQNAELSAEFCREHAFDPPGSYVLLSVSDTGMDTATIAHMFEPFFTTKETGKGTGLGLATAYGIVKQHGGFISASSEPGKGTSFQGYPPAANGAHESRVAEREDQPLRGTETILFAEDHDGLRETAQEMLQVLGHRLLVASDCKKALELFKIHAKQIDLIVMDVVMPSLSGPEAYLEMSALRSGVRVILHDRLHPGSKGSDFHNGQGCSRPAKTLQSYKSESNGPRGTATATPGLNPRSLLNQPEEPRPIEISALTSGPIGEVAMHLILFTWLDG